MKRAGVIALLRRKFAAYTVACSPDIPASAVEWVRR